MPRYKDYIVLDLETTGISIKKRNIIEYAFLRVRNSEIVDKKVGLVNPRESLRNKIIEITSINDEMLKYSPYIEEILPDIIKFIDDDILIAHNINIDYSFLKKACERMDIDFYKKGIDTLELCRKFMPYENKKNLKDACKYYNINVEKSHRAYDDAYNTYLLYEKLADIYYNDEIFQAKILKSIYKSEKKASKRAKDGLIKFLNYHKIKLSLDIDKLSQNEISRIIDHIKANNFIYVEEKNEKK